VQQATASAARKERLQESKKAAHDTMALADIVLATRRQQRAESIGQLLRSASSLIIYGIATLLILTTLGIDIGPLIASAGVIGVALGFGAQTLVKDYLSGVFLVIEDQYGIGDLVDLGPVIGTVEEVALRVTRLRDQSGVVWYVRNGEILRVANRSQGWTLSTIDLPVAYDEDLERVRELIDAAGQAMDEDPAYDDMLLAAPYYAGVESVSGEAVFVRVLAKSVPDKQIPTTRAIRERMKAVFDEAGVRVPVIPRMPLGPGGPTQ
jgi:small conductance mechanosensitive channel